MNAVRRYRERALLTQRALGAALGVTVSTVARWETLPDDKLPLKARQFLLAQEQYETHGAVTGRWKGAAQ